LTQLPEDSLAGVVCSVSTVRGTVSDPPQPSCTCRQCSLEPALSWISDLVTLADVAPTVRECKGVLKTARHATRVLRTSVGSLTRKKCLAPADRGAVLKTETTDLGHRLKALSASGFCKSR
jgi:hypothetical protein